MTDELHDACDACDDVTPPCPTLCDGDTTNNCWVEGGVCMLDQMNASQVTYILQKSPAAREDLRRVTTCQELLDLVDEVPLLDTKEEEDRLQTTLNDNANTLPFYTLFRGNFNNM